MNSIKRSELYNMAESSGLIDPNDYILQVIRANPDLEIIDDITNDFEAK